MEGRSEVVRGLNVAVGVLGNAWNAAGLDEDDHGGCWFVGCLVQFVAGEALPVMDVDDHGGCGFDALAMALEHGGEGYMVAVKEWQANGARWHFGGV